MLYDMQRRLTATVQILSTTTTMMYGLSLIDPC